MRQSRVGGGGAQAGLHGDPGLGSTRCASGRPDPCQPRSAPGAALPAACPPRGPCTAQPLAQASPAGERQQGACPAPPPKRAPARPPLACRLGHLPFSAPGPDALGGPGGRGPTPTPTGGRELARAGLADRKGVGLQGRGRCADPSWSWPLPRQASPPPSARGPGDSGCVGAGAGVFISGAGALGGAAPQAPGHGSSGDLVPASAGPPAS